MADGNVLHGCGHPALPVGANPAHFCITHRPTDRLRQPTAVSRSDVNHLYFAFVGELFAPIRTMDPSHVRTTQTSASYTHLLDHPTASPEAIRLAITTAALDARLPPLLQETQLKVRADALHIGDRCTKPRGATKGKCDLCYFLLGSSVPETLDHILLTCPFTAPVVTAVWRTAFLKHADPSAYAATAHLMPADFVQRFERMILFGVTSFDTPQLRRTLTVPATVLAAATNTCLIRRRNHNAHNCACPLQHDSPALIRNIFHTACRTATAMRTLAQGEERWMYTHYEGWMPADEDEWPTNVWRSRWCGLLRDTRPQTSPAFPLPLPPSPDAADEPTYDLTAPDVQSRLRQHNRT